MGKRLIVAWTMIASLAAMFGCVVLTIKLSSGLGTVACILGGFIASGVSAWCGCWLEEYEENNKEKDDDKNGQG